MHGRWRKKKLAKRFLLTLTVSFAHAGTYARLVRRQLMRQNNQIPEQAQAADVVDALVDEEQAAQT